MAWIKLHKERFLLLFVVAVTALIGGACLLVDRFWHLSSYFEFDLEALFGFYAAQLSLTFISISVMSVLSDKTVVIYWENIAEKRLIEPVFTCFAAYTYYSIGATVAAGIFTLWVKSFPFVVFFALNVAVLILLTVAVVDVYFDTEAKKQELINELRRLYENRGDAYSAELYEMKMLRLKQYTLTAVEQNDLLTRRDNLALVIDHGELFVGEDAEEVVRILVQLGDADSARMFLQSLELDLQKKLLDFMKDGSVSAPGRVVWETILKQAKEHSINVVKQPEFWALQDCLLTQMILYLNGKKKIGAKVAEADLREALRELDGELAQDAFFTTLLEVGESIFYIDNKFIKPKFFEGFSTFPIWQCLDALPSNEKAKQLAPVSKVKGTA